MYSEVKPFWPKVLLFESQLIKEMLSTLFVLLQIQSKKETSSPLPFSFVDNVLAKLKFWLQKHCADFDMKAT